jgi:hypothetical protein
MEGPREFLLDCRLNNSSFGFSLINRGRYNKTSLVGEKQYEKKFRSSRFSAGQAVGRPGLKQVTSVNSHTHARRETLSYSPYLQESLIELSLRPTRITEQPVILLGFSILSGAKGLLVRFVAHLIRFLQEGSWSLMGGVRFC